MLAVFLLAVAVVPSGQSFICTPVRVWDGDGPIWCREGPRIRLAGIAAREIDGSCRRGHPCPRASGIAARDTLVRLLGGARGRTGTGHILVAGPRLRCRSNGNAKGNRTGAWCTAPVIGDISCAMLATGVVLRWNRYAVGHCR
ncbi:thermonuclease family protein [Sphingomonas sp. NPDC079357]|uniref:thermonuclease family protein n=1 Tax=Sphingomonas sp. NPDC079357 TaxID=3364518 RepID=UPI00384CE882